MFHKLYHSAFSLVIIALLLQGCAAAPATATPPDTANTQPIPTVLEPESPASQPVSEEARLEPLTEPAAATPLPQPVDPASPRGILTSFYTWYLETARAENPLASQAYAGSPYLTDYLIDTTRQALEGFIEGGYDPFLCAQDLPGETSVEALFVSGGLARAVVSSDFPGHTFNVALALDNEGWKIDAVECGGTPAAAVSAFYTWYLGSIYGDADAQDSPEIQQNLLASRAYRQSPFLTAGLAAEVDALLDEQSEMGGGDPFLAAQTLPYDYWIAPGQAGPEIVVRLHFGPQSARYLHVGTVEEDGQWKIDSIRSRIIPQFDPNANAGVDTAAWPEFADLAHGFTLRYPPGWRVVESVNKTALQPPYELTVWLGPGDTKALEVEVLGGSEAEIEPFLIVESRQRVLMNDLEVFVEREPDAVRYRLQHPNRPGVWLAVTDLVSENSLYEGAELDVEGMIAPLLRSIVFRE